ncbi:MAG: hypothetical protein JSR91_04870 [Proteobacteria bacterium]|nr:hypothetical protein [Pseudomonadota bacterium]
MILDSSSLTTGVAAILPLAAVLFVGSVAALVSLVVRLSLRTMPMELRVPVLRLLQFVAGASAIAGVPSVLLGTLFLFRPERGDAIALIVGAIALMLALGAVANWCDHRIEADMAEAAKSRRAAARTPAYQPIRQAARQTAHRSDAQSNGPSTPTSRPRRRPF